ncbi:MAG: Gfo/Idh/MocA family protein [Acidimicrobiia bacterium]
MIGIAVVGAGHWGPNLIRALDDSPHAGVRWVVDRDVSRLAQVEIRFPGIRTAQVPDELWTADDVDAVVIATPTSTHADLAEAALRAGKHVLVEKPITDDAARAAEITELARASGLVLMVGHVLLFHGGVQAVRQLVEDGELGRIFHVSMVRTNLGPIRVDVDAAWDLASHDISIANYWLGAGPGSASAIGGSWINPGLADAVFMTLRYPKEILVNLHVSWLNPRKVRDITVVGDRKMLTFDDMNLTEPLRIYDKGVSVERVSPEWVDTFGSFRASVREGTIVIPKVPLGEPLRSECGHFVECVRLGKQPLSDGEFGTEVVRVLEAINRSMANGGREEQL